MRRVERFMRFNGVAVLGIGVQLLVVHVLISVAALDARVATAAGVATAVIHNFLWHWRWTWADRRILNISLMSSFACYALTNGLLSLAGNVASVSLLTSSGYTGPMVANVVAIALCGLVNFWAADRVVFDSTPLIRTSATRSSGNGTSQASETCL